MNIRVSVIALVMASAVAILAESPKEGQGARIQEAQNLAAAGNTSDAIAQLETVVDFGLRFNADHDAWAPLRQDGRFVRLVSRMRARTAPLLRSERAFLLDKELIPENIAWDPKTGSFYVGSMYKAKIIRIASDGQVTDFVPPRRDGLLSVLGMKIDATRRELWAAAGNFIDRPPMEHDEPSTYGKGAIFRFNLDSGALIARYDAVGGTAEKPFWFNDLVLTPAGDVFATAGDRGVWRLPNGGKEFESFVSPAGEFFNGIAVTPDGKTLFGASHSTGIIRIDVATKSATPIDVPPGATLRGIDGLYFHEESLVGIQNGTAPQRVVRAWLDPEERKVTRFVVLEQDHPEWDIPLTGAVVGDHLYYVAKSQLRAFENGKIWPADRLKESVILKLPLEPAGAEAPELVRERAALLEMHHGELRAHIERDARWLADTTGETFVSATRGKIGRSTPDQTRAFFSRYFEGASYPQYEDAEPPIVSVSNDGSMGWVISRTRVRRIEANGTESGFVYAGMMAYEKRDGAWVRVGNASTFE